MCGIAGIISYKKRQINDEFISKVFRTMDHRGPDDEGYLFYNSNSNSIDKGSNLKHNFELRGVGLFHKRLSIIDIGTSGWQPMTYGNDKYAIVFNGEIYNYIELKQELTGLGFSFTSTSDTEVLLAAYIAWGNKMLLKLEGMFAFAILDIPNKKFFLARDPFGIKPLYFSILDKGFVFSSELKTLLSLPEVKRKVDSQRIYSFFRAVNTDYGMDTFYRNIKQLPPAHYMELSLITERQAIPQRYWDLGISETLDVSFEEAKKNVREIFLKSIDLHMRSDVPVSTTLSGGIDSSAIVMAIRHLYPNREINAFSYIAKENSLSEEKWVDIVCKKGKIINHKISPNELNLIEEIEELIKLQEEPILTTSIFAQYNVFKSIKEQKFKVTLDGQGADELLGGYHGFLVGRLASLIKKGENEKAEQFYNYISQKLGMSLSLLSSVNNYLLPRNMQIDLRYSQPTPFFPEWLNYDWFQKNQTDFDFFYESYIHDKDILKKILYNAVTEKSLPKLLRYQDRNSMASSIESRVPFLNKEFAEYILKLPEDYIISNQGTTKYIFREAMRGIVPDEILNRKDKIGFSTPESSWLINIKPWVDEVLNSKVAHEIPLFNLVKLKEDWSAISSGKKSYDARVWRWISFIKWIELSDVEF